MPPFTLVDTSIWSEIWSDTAAGKALKPQAENLILENQIVINNIILCELLKNHEDQTGMHQRLQILESIPVINLSKEDSILAAEIFIKLRKKGIKPKTPDLLIAAQAINQGWLIWSLDKDFQKIAKHTDLKLF